MKKWTSLSIMNEEVRWKLLSQALADAGAVNEYIPWTGANDGFVDIEGLSAFDHVRVSSRLAPDLVRQLKVQSSWTTLLGVADGMNNTPNGWWPLCALHEAFGDILVQLGQNLDKRGNVFIAGAGGAARIALAAFFKAGFQNFLITSFDESEAMKMIQDVKARFFGLSVQWVPTDRIVLLPGESTVLVNCTPSTDENVLLRELSYLNFLKRPGFLFDLSRSAKPSVLVQEANEAAVRVVTGIELAARTDVLWAKWAFQATLEVPAYRDKLTAAFAAIT